MLTISSGLFTCEVDDFGDVQRQDVRLDVVRSPVIVITPLAANVRQGEAVSFRCYSPDELLRSYSYRWLKVCNRKPRIVVNTMQYNFIAKCQYNLHEECFVVPRTLITHSLQSLKHRQRILVCLLCS